MLVGSVTLTLDRGPSCSGPSSAWWRFPREQGRDRPWQGRGDRHRGRHHRRARGGFLAQVLNISFSIPGHTTITAIVIAFVGAVILLVIVRLVTGGGRRWSRSG